MANRFDNRYKFKSKNPYYQKEKEGVKPNTVREIDLSDSRYLELIAYMVLGFPAEELKVEIVNADNSNEYFVRRIKDISIWNNLMIISWYHT